MTVSERWSRGPIVEGRVPIQRDQSGEFEIWLARPEGVLTFCHAGAIMPVIPVREDAQFEDCLKRFRAIWQNVLFILGSNAHAESSVDHQ